MLELIGVDGLTQWDVGRQVNVDKDVDMVHFSNRPYGYSKNVKVTDGVADVPDMFLTSCAPLRVWAYVGDFEKGYTKIEKIYEVKPKNRPEDYIYTPEDVKTWEKLQSEIGDLAGLKTEAKENLVAAINEAVLYTAQSLTEEQQAHARQNIGAQDLYNGLTPVNYSCTDGTYSVSDTVYLESGNIISPTDTVSNDVRIAFMFINLWNIANQLEYWKNDIKKYKLLIDNGYLENNTIWYSKPDKKFKKQIRFGTNSTLGNYIIFNFNYNYEVIGQLVYYVDTDTISTGKDTYLNRKLTRDKNNVLSYSAIKLASDPTEPMQIATKQYVDNSIAASGTDISLGLTSAAVGQIIKVKAIDASGKPTAWEAADMQSGGDEWELIAHINVVDDVEKGVTVWEYNNLPRYKYIAYKKVSLVGSSDQTASGCTIMMNGESSQPSGMTYGKSGFPQSCIGVICVIPFGWTHCKTADANTPNNIALGGVNAMLTALPLSDNAITSIKLSAHPTYKIVSGEIWLYGKKG